MNYNVNYVLTYDISIQISTIQTIEKILYKSLM